MNDFNKIHAYFNISPQNEKDLKLFFNTQGEKLLALSILMEKKRWREVLTTIKYVNLLFSYNKLSYYWSRYLSSFNALDQIPETTLKESVSFLNYLLKKHSDNHLLCEIIRYEKTRNAICSFEFNKNDNKDSDQQFHDSHQIMINPSCLKLEFCYPISKIINELSSNNLLDLNNYARENENIVFYKIRSKNSVKTMHLSHLGNFLFTQMTQAKSLTHWKETITSTVKSHKNIFDKFIKNMIDNELISIVKTKRAEYVL